MYLYVLPKCLNCVIYMYALPTHFVQNWLSHIKLLTGVNHITLV